MEKPSVFATILAGSCAGASETIVTVRYLSKAFKLESNLAQFPFEFLKTRRQLPAYSSQTTATIVRNVYASSGFQGFYAGCSTLVVSNAIKASVRFLSFSAAQSYFGKHLRSVGVGSTGVNVVAGLSAGVAESILVVTPGECVKTRMIQQAGNRTGIERLTPITALRDMIRHEGILAPWKGMGPVLLKQGTNSAVRFSTFESLKKEVATRWPGQEQSVAMNLLLGGISGVVTVYVHSINPRLIYVLTMRPV